MYSMGDPMILLTKHKSSLRPNMYRGIYTIFHTKHTIDYNTLLENL